MNHKVDVDFSRGRTITSAQVANGIGARMPSVFGIQTAPLLKPISLRIKLREPGGTRDNEFDSQVAHWTVAAIIDTAEGDALKVRGDAVAVDRPECGGA